MKQARERLVIHWREWGLLRQRRHLQALLGQPLFVGAEAAAGADATWIGWGRRPSGQRAQRRAERCGGRFLLLEDGFIRSFGLGRAGAAPLSIVADGTGVHYDATQPSDIETMLNTAEVSPQELKEAAEIIALLRRHGIGKFNDGAPVPPGTFDGERERVLVVDQTAGDLSISYGMAGERTFREMIEAALDENPQAEILVKVHPDVLAGLRQGCVPHLKDARLRYIAENWHAHDLLQHVQKVYVATSLMGLEALLLGREVHCFGMPFYAGWGLTHDRQKLDRRQRRRSLEELAALALLRYARYLNPETGKPGTARDVILHLARQKRMHRFWHDLQGSPWSGRVFAFGFHAWKPAQITPFFGAGARMHYCRNVRQARRRGISAADRIAVWGLREPQGVRELAAELKLDIVRVEDGFLRSAGLGADFVPPLSLVFDRRGIYFDPAQESDLEHILQHAAFDEELLKEAQRLRSFIVERRLTKYLLPRHELAQQVRQRAGGRRIVLVPGQVESDASILRGCGEVRTNMALLQAAREEEPEAFIIYKPHPDVMAGNRDGAAHAREALQWCDHIETRADIVSCIEAADAVHTMTSLAGFDALLRQRRVVCHGQPFYAGWGLTEDRAPLPRRRRRLTLDELVAGALILYPRYLGRHGFVSAMAAAERLAQQAEHTEAGIERLARKWGRLARDVLRSAPAWLGR